MGVLRTGFDTCDNCCTVCCLGVGAACLVTVALPLSVGISVLAAPYTIPMYHIRSKKYTKMLQESFLKLPIVYREIMMKEFNFQTIEDITFSRYVKHLKKLKKIALSDREECKYTTKPTSIAEQKFLQAPQELLKNIVFKCTIHTFDEVHTMNSQFAQYLITGQ